MLSFRSILPEDGAWARPLLTANGFVSCEFNFSNIYIYRNVYGSRIARLEDFVLVCHENEHYVSAMYPAGSGDLNRCLEALVEYAGDRSLYLYSVPPDRREELLAALPQLQISLLPSRSNFDYILDIHDFLALPGSRNQHNRYALRKFFQRFPGAAFTPITAADHADIRTFAHQWGDQYGGPNRQGVQEERQVLEEALSQYDTLGLVGGILRSQGEILGFSIGSPLNDQILCGHIQKARRDCRGAFLAVATSFAKLFGGSYRWLNCEDDLGILGLREAKLSYHPAWLEEKYIAVLKGVL